MIKRDKYLNQLIANKDNGFPKGGSATDAVYEYMQFGGMPLAVLKSDSEKKEYLKGLFETTYFRDILIKHNCAKWDKYVLEYGTIKPRVGVTPTLVL